MDDDARCSTEPEAVKQIVEEMIDHGFAPVVMLFLSPDGTTRLWHRQGLDAEDLLRFIVATGAAREARH